MKFKVGDRVMAIPPDDEYEITKRHTIWTVERCEGKQGWLKGNKDSPEKWRTTSGIPLGVEFIFPLNAERIKERLGLK